MYQKNSIGGLLRPVQNVMNEFVRTRISCSKMDGKEKSVKTAMERYFRLAKRVWIRSMPGQHTHLYRKPLETKFQLQQPVLVGRKESKMLERMSGRYYKRIRLERFVDAPFTYYQPFLKQVYKIASPVPKGRFYP